MVHLEVPWNGKVLQTHIQTEEADNVQFEIFPTDQSGSKPDYEAKRSVMEWIFNSTSRDSKYCSLCSWFDSFAFGNRLSTLEIPHSCTAIGCINLHMNVQQGFSQCKISFIIQGGTFQIEGITTSLMPFISMIGNGSIDSKWIIKRSEIFPPVFMDTAWLKTESHQPRLLYDRLDCILM